MTVGLHPTLSRTVLSRLRLRRGRAHGRRRSPPSEDLFLETSGYGKDPVIGRRRVRAAASSPYTQRVHRTQRGLDVSGETVRALAEVTTIPVRPPNHRSSPRLVVSEGPTQFANEQAKALKIASVSGNVVTEGPRDETGLVGVEPLQEFDGQFACESQIDYSAMEIRPSPRQGNEGIGEDRTEVLGPEDEGSGHQDQAGKPGPSLLWPATSAWPQAGAKGRPIARFPSQEPDVVGTIPIMMFQGRQGPPERPCKASQLAHKAKDLGMPAGFALRSAPREVVFVDNTGFRIPRPQGPQGRQGVQVWRGPAHRQTGTLFSSPRPKGDDPNEGRIKTGPL